MSSSDLTRWLRPAGRTLAIGLTFTLAGCFQPMYGGASGGQARADLAAIKVLPIPDRLGHYLENELIFALGGGNTPTTTRYNLTVKVQEASQTPLIDTTSGRATAGTVVTRATYTLTAVADGKVVTVGTAVTAASFDRTGQRYADVRANRDAEIRDAKALSDQIQTRIASALAGKS